MEEEHFILIQMVLPNIKKEMDKIKNEEVEPEMEEEEPEEVEERVFNHLQQQRNSQRKQFQPSDLYETLWFLLIIHISKVILYSLNLLSLFIPLSSLEKDCYPNLWTRYYVIIIT